MNKATAGSAATGYTGDVVVIPSTQTAEDNTGTDKLIKYKSHDPVPGVANTKPWPADHKGLTAVGGKMTILGGSDQYLGALTHIATTLTTTFANAAGNTLTGTAEAYPLPAGITTARKNDNTNGAYDIYNSEGTAKATDVWMIGAKAMGVHMVFTMGTAADWKTMRSQVVVCAPQTGVLSSTLEMRGGTKTGEFCTAAFNYAVGQQDINVNKEYEKRSLRFCRWCSATRTDPLGQIFIAAFVPPTTSTRKIKGISIWAADTTGKQYLTIDTYSTLTVQAATKVKTGDCGKDSQTLKRGTAGQVAEFTIKNSIALAGEQVVVWESTNTKIFILQGSTTKDKSVRCSCTGASGSNYSWNTILTKARTNLRMVLKLPAAADAKITEVVCAAGTVSCVARDWEA